MNAVWTRTLGFTGAVLVGMLVVRALSDWTTAFTFTAVVFLLRYLRDAIHLQTLWRWSLREPGSTLPRSSGAWEELYAQLYHRNRATQREIDTLTRALISFRGAAQALPEGVVTLNSHNQILWCNAQAEEHLNLKLTKDEGQSVTNLVRAPDFLGYLSRGEWDKPVQLRVRHSMQGAERVLSLQLVEYGDAQKLLLSRDITRFERLETMRRDFVANVSHELKTPLTVLSGFLETISESALTPKQQADYLALMREQAERMQRLVDDLLTLSALEANNTPHDDLVDASHLFERVESTARQLSAGRHRIVFNIEPGLSLTGAELELTSTFANLVTNAIRYTQDGGEVRVTWASTDDGGASLSVQDNGIGIPAHHLPRLTERFYRVDRGRSRQSGGTGLGLAIVKHVLTRHQGTLAITSEVGKGSTFTATLPAKRIVRHSESTDVVDESDVDRDAIDAERVVRAA